MAVGMWPRLTWLSVKLMARWEHPVAKHKPTGTPPWPVRPVRLNAINDEATVAQLRVCGAQASQKRSAERGRATAIGAQQRNLLKHMVWCRQHAARGCDGSSSRGSDERIAGVHVQGARVPMHQRHDIGATGVGNMGAAAGIRVAAAMASHMW